MAFKFCPACGEALKLRDVGDEGLVPYCLPCEHLHFPSATPCVLVLAMNDERQVALLRQDYVTKDHWVLVAGYHAPGESAEECAAREVREETGLTVLSTRYVASYYQEKKNLLLLGFFARVAGVLSDASSEVDATAWFRFEDVPAQLRPGSTGLKLYEAVQDLLNGS